MKVHSVMNMQLAVKGDDLCVIEVNPRASRTAPFVSKAIGVPLPKLAAKIMAGKTLKELGFTEEVIPRHHSVKEAVFPFSKFTGVDIILGPEMKSTGEVMGIDYDLGMAFAKSQMAAGGTLPTKGNVFISVKETDCPNVVRTPTFYADLGFTLYATSGTGSVITEAGIPVNILPKLASGQRPNVIDLMKNKDMALVINTPSGKNPPRRRSQDPHRRHAKPHPHHDHPPWRRCRAAGDQVTARQRGAGNGFAEVSWAMRFLYK